LQKANADLRHWLDTVANQRKHGTHRQAVIDRWHQEKPLLAPLPASDYDTSVKVFRKVYRDCQISYEANHYLLPHHVVGKRVMLKIKDGTIRFFHDDQLLVTYQQSEGRHQLVGNQRFYEQLKADRSQQKRKYGRNKAAATRGLTNASLFPQVMYRPLSDYDRLAQGGGLWNN
jgi:hypothetical protein